MLIKQDYLVLKEIDRNLSDVMVTLKIETRTVCDGNTEYHKFNKTEHIF